MMLLGLLLVLKLLFTFACYPDFNYSDTDSARGPQSKFPSPTSSAAPKGEQKVSPANKEKTKIQEAADHSKAISVPHQNLEIVRAIRAVDVSEATNDSMSVKKGASQ